MLILLTITVITNLVTRLTIGIGTLRVAIMLAVSFINLVLANYKFHRLSKYSLLQPKLRAVSGLPPRL
jgi:hypothetical protein